MQTNEGILKSTIRQWESSSVIKNTYKIKIKQYLFYINSKVHEEFNGANYFYRICLWHCSFQVVHPNFLFIPGTSMQRDKPFMILHSMICFGFPKTFKFRVSDNFYQPMSAATRWPFTLLLTCLYVAHIRQALSLYVNCVVGSAKGTL